MWSFELVSFWSGSFVTCTLTRTSRAAVPLTFFFLDLTQIKRRAGKAEMNLV
jgi:hypothetical protein